MLPIHMISLAKDTVRRAEACAQLNKQNITFDIFDALNGERGAALFDSLDDYAFILHTGRRYTQGEIGCFASHKALWQRCVDANRALLVMEDDFLLTPAFSAAVEAAETLIDELGLVRLQDERRGAAQAVMPFGQFQLERYTKTPHCTLCYAISPKIARRLLDLHRVFRAPVDVVMKHVWQFNNPMYCLTPYTVSSSDLSYDSVISGREKCPKTLLTRLRRSWLKTTWQWHRLVFNLRQSDTWIRRRFSTDGRRLPDAK
ncbi:MAG: glycosyltransferase family 25 protein [Woeseia sp.]